MFILKENGHMTDVAYELWDGHSIFEFVRLLFTTNGTAIITTVPPNFVTKTSKS